MDATWVWIPLSIFAALMQAVRTAAQKTLNQSMSTMGTTYVRSLFGMPALLVFLGVVAAVGTAMDYIAGMLGAKFTGASKTALWGALIGGIAGAFFSLPGLLLGPGPIAGIVIAGACIVAVVGAAVFIRVKRASVARRRFRSRCPGRRSRRPYRALSRWMRGRILPPRRPPRVSPMIRMGFIHPWHPCNPW